MAQITITGPTDEEKAKRRQWALEKRRKDESKNRVEQEKKSAEDLRKRLEEEARLESRRAAIREKILKQHEIQVRA